LSLSRLLAEAQSRGLLADAGDGGRWAALVARVNSEVRAGLCAEQLAFLDDPCRYRVACCARQCGKTFLVARLMVLTAIGGRDRIVVYVSDTFRHAREAMWDDQLDGLPAVLHSLGFQEGSDYRINLSGLRVTFANGSFVELQGADRGAWSGFRGRKIDLLVADEMQRQEQEHLELALTKDVPDCLMMRRGSFLGIGTVGRSLRGIWFELNAGVHGLCPARPGWTAHHWTARELRHLTPVWDEQLAWCAAMGIDIETDPEQQREKLGRWVRDEQRLVHVLTDSSTWDGTLPTVVRTRCREHGHLRGRCVCPVPSVPRSEAPAVYAGLDLGAGQREGDGDPMGLCVVSVSREEGVIREVHSEQRFVRDSDDLLAWLRRMVSEHGIRGFYVDGSWKLTVLDMARLLGIPVLATDKGNVGGQDEDFWTMERRSALRQGSMQVLRDSLLRRQLESIVRDEAEAERGHIRSAPGQDDHTYDAWRYVFRMVRTNHVPAPEAPLDMNQRKMREIEAAVSRQSQRTADDGRHRTAGSRRR
jgi:hypothetical protein